MDPTDPDQQHLVLLSLEAFGISKFCQCPPLSISEIKGFENKIIRTRHKYSSTCAILTVLGCWSEKVPKKYSRLEIRISFGTMIWLQVTYTAR
jgi:hypothetical protein